MCQSDNTQRAANWCLRAIEEYDAGFHEVARGFMDNASTALESELNPAPVIGTTDVSVGVNITQGKPPTLPPMTVQEGIKIAEEIAGDVEMRIQHCEIMQIGDALSGALGCFGMITDYITFIAEPENAKECLLDAVKALRDLRDQLRGEE